MVFFGERVDAPSLAVAGVAWVFPSDPSLDVALVELEEPISSEVAIPLRLSTLGPNALLGARLLLAGSGVTEDDLLGHRRFVTEEVTNVQDGIVVVDGRGRSGACIADSGSPALWREGEPVLVGVLTEGDSSCRGSDSYVSVSSFSDWAKLTIANEPETMPGCGRLPAEGGCFNTAQLQQAVWCESAGIKSGFCKEEKAERCGWSAADRGFRCVPFDQDPCKGVSQLGTCHAGKLLNCTNGSVEQHSCGACGACNIAPATGAASCL